MFDLQNIINSPLISKDENNIEHCVYFSKWMIKKIEQKQEAAMREGEDGGILLGRIQGNDLMVTFSTHAYKNDKRKRFEFIRYDERHLKVWKSVVKRTKAQIGYLGEWHSHPEKNPTPSKIDRIEWKKIEKQVGRPLLFLIIGTEKLYLEGMF